MISGSGQLGIWIRGPGAAGNVVQQNLIGTDISGTLDFGNRFPGIWIDRAPGNLIGGTSPAARNVISGNDQSGVYLSGTTATGNILQGNYIGTDITGSVDLGNSFAGVNLFDSPDNLIGGASPCAGNVISGNDQTGVFLRGVSADRNLIQGNLVGTDATGMAELPNATIGIVIFQGSDNVIGGVVPLRGMSSPGIPRTVSLSRDWSLTATQFKETTLERTLLERLISVMAVTASISATGRGLFPLLQVRHHTRLLGVNYRTRAT